MKSKTYADAVYRVKRGFLILGLSGYTGSGCTTVQKLLSSSSKPEYSVVKEPADHRSERVDSKLRSVWNDLSWEPFIPIEVSKVIFALVVNEALKSETESPEAKLIRSMIGAESNILDNLNLLCEGAKIGEDNATYLIEAFEHASSFFAPFKNKSTNTLGEFIDLFQSYGDSLRKIGLVFSENEQTASPDNLFLIPEAIRRLIKAYRVAQKKHHFVIDAFRNSYEVEYFKRRYGEFYLVGILRGQQERISALDNLSPEERSSLDVRERGKLYSKSKNNIAEWMSSQNIDECLRKADIFIHNINDSGKRFHHLKSRIIKLIALAQKPGCIPPTNEERNMQLAMTARQMSGCISRQVGAVVVGSDGYILGFGWNDPPKGQTPCSLRSGRVLLEAADEAAFSDYEKSEQFIDHIKSECNSDRPFCFREEYSEILSKGKVGEFTRALHAEENAIFQALRNNAQGIMRGTLYTTDSPCNLCCKKAYQVGIKRIIFIEEYPGISMQQTLRTGEEPVEFCHFEGIIGSAYFRLYESLMPEKDLIKLYSV